MLENRLHALTNSHQVLAKAETRSLLCWRKGRTARERPPTFASSET